MAYHINLRYHPSNSILFVNVFSLAGLDEYVKKEIASLVFLAMNLQLTAHQRD